MFARSLVVFVMVGAFSGLALGAYLGGLGDPEPVFQEGAWIHVKTDMQTYALGEEVRVLLTNTGSEDLPIPSDYRMRITGLSGFTVYEFAPEGQDALLAPGEERIISWGQVRNDKTAVPVGIYKVHVEAGPARGSATFTIGS